jgi:hypothetical protein
MSISSDPAYIDIDLSNEDHVLSINVNIAKNISSSDETYTFNDITAVPGSASSPPFQLPYLTTITNTALA